MIRGVTQQQVWVRQYLCWETSRGRWRNANLETADEAWKAGIQKNLKFPRWVNDERSIDEHTTDTARHRVRAGTESWVNEAEADSRRSTLTCGGPDLARNSNRRHGKATSASGPDGVVAPE